MYICEKRDRRKVIVPLYVRGITSHALLLLLYAHKPNQLLIPSHSAVYTSYNIIFIVFYDPLLSVSRQTMYIVEKIHI